ncbi:CUBN-like protein [Mya arenaria]|uniref:CUBN-like protein n=1 Tax=Mya arenaria TaxID=6604 RepID=A0ABY7E9C6_MYAAR|nr:CUBN-like protein [Mya arenaria]
MRYSWTRGGYSIIASERFSFDSSAQRKLTIANLARNDNQTVIGCTATEERVCSNTLTNFSGVIESPNFPNAYPHNLNCTWVIDTTMGNTVNISFSHFSLEKNCNFDYLKINDGDQPTSTSLGTFCGTNLPQPISSSTDKVWINFITDHSVAKNGFRLQYITNGCGGYLRTPTGSFISPNYPNPYPHRRQCEWTIYGGPDDTAPRLAQLCHHQNSPQVLSSPGNTMFVRFKSDGSTAGNGFNVTYRTVTGCGGNFTIQRGTIVSKNYPNNYPNSSVCEWLVTVKDRHNIELEFTDFDVEGASSDCRYDYVAVYDGPSIDATELMKHCGNSLPNSTRYRSLSNQLYIRMKTDGSVSRRGFRANYTTDVSLSPSQTSYTVTEGNTLVPITCSATCYPVCLYTWSRLGVTVSSTATLNLGQAERAEAGSYVCTARHPGLGVSRTGPLVGVAIRYGPDIRVHNGPENLSLSPSQTTYTVTEGHTLVSITCSATCNPACTYKWSRSGVAVSSTATLNLGQVVRGVAGSYICTARNPGSNITRNGKTVNVNVRYGPDNMSLSPSTTSYTVTEGDTIKAITCAATCNPACTYTWSRSGSTVNSTATLNLGQAVRGEAGSYVCTATNPVLDVSRNGPDNVYLSPSTTSYTVTDGNNIGAISCSATCNPACTYKWSRSGVAVSSTATLNLGQVVRGQAGSYICTARNPGSNITRNGKTVNVNVRYGPDDVSLSPSQTSYTVTEGHTLVPITCSATCNPACTYTWSRPGVTVSSTAILNLHQTEKAEAGSYGCTARNQWSNITRNGPIVSVNGPTAVALSPGTLNYTKNEDDTLAPITCSADCFPACNIIWRKTSGILGIVSSNASFNLRELNRTDRGRYKCVATNPYTFTNTTNGPDRITLNESNIHTVTEGDAVSNIYCSADCWPGCVYTWSNLTNNQTMVSSAILVFGTVNRYDAGDYMCLAWNTAPQFSGVASKHFTLHAPDVAISQSNTLLLENTPLNLRCKALGVPAVYNYAGFVQRVGDIVVPNRHVENPGVMDSISVNIPSLQLQDTGIYTCYVHNNVTGLDKQLIQTASQNIEVSASPQFFLEETYFVGETSGNITIEVPFVSFPEYTSYSVIRHDGQLVLMNGKNTLRMRNDSVFAVFYGQQVTLSGNVLQVIISDLAEKDFGIYKIQITNDINTANLSIDIMAKSKPSPPTELNLTTLDKTVTFEWEKGFNGGNEQTFVLNTSLNSDGSWMFITTVKESELKYIEDDGKFHVSLTNLEPGVYSARIMSFNIFGATDPVEFKNSFEIMEYSKDASARKRVLVIGGTTGAIAGALLVVFVIVVFIKRKYACSIKFAEREDMYQNTHSEPKTVTQGVDNPQYNTEAQTYEELSMTTDIGVYTDLKNVDDGPDNPNIYAQLDESSLNPVTSDDTVEKEDPIYINLVLKNPAQLQKTPFTTASC